MNTDWWTPETLISSLLDPVRRARILAALRNRRRRLEARNVYAELASQCAASPDELRRAVQVILDCESPKNAELLLRELLLHREVPVDALMLALDRKCGIDALGHRSGPRELLERLASEYSYPEAVTTLALDYYGADDGGVEQFADFIREHGHDLMLQYNLRESRKLSPAKRQIALEIISQSRTPKTARIRKS